MSYAQCAANRVETQKLPACYAVQHTGRDLLRLPGGSMYRRDDDGGNRGFDLFFCIVLSDILLLIMLYSYSIIGK